MSISTTVVGIVVSDTDSLTLPDTSFFPLQVTTSVGSATVYFPPSPSKIAAETRRATSVVLTPRIPDKPAAAIEALRLQGVSRVVLLCPISPRSQRSLALSHENADSSVSVCVLNAHDCVGDNTECSSTDSAQSCSLRHLVEEPFLQRNLTVARQELQPTPLSAILECEEAAASQLEACVLCFAHDQSKDILAEVEGRIISTLLRGLMSMSTAETGASTGSLEECKSALGGVGYGSPGQSGSSSYGMTNASNGRSLSASGEDPFADPPKQVVDVLIAARWVVPMEPDEHTVLGNHSVVIDGGKVLEILPTVRASAKYAPRSRIERPQHVAMPGLINAHTHTGMTLMRGCADDQTLLKWLRETVWPIEMAFVSSDSFCEDGAMLAVAEMLRGGVTTFADMYWYPEAAARVAIQTGVRAVLGMIILAFPSSYAANADEYIEKGHQLRERHMTDSNLHFAYAPHAPYTVSDEIWKKLRDLSARNGLPIHTHLHETSDECIASACLDRGNPACHMSDQACRPIENFRRIGLLSRRLIGAHMTQLSKEEIQLCAEHRVNVVNCPTSNAKLASGFCPVPELLASGVNVAIGTDSAASNNSLDLFAEMKLGALLAKNVTGDATVVPASTALRMVTTNAAEALGISEVTGSLLPGKAADVICVEIETHAGNTPMFSVQSALVYASSRHDVTDVFVEGQHLLRDKALTRIDEGALVTKVKNWSSRISAKFPRVGLHCSNDDIFPADRM